MPARRVLAESPWVRPVRRARRGPGLTPLIDVVFLLLVFFMLASRFETEALLPLAVRVADAASDATDTRRPLRVELDADGTPSLDGAPRDATAVQHALAAAVADDRPVRVRPHADTPLQPLVDVLALARSAGARDVAIERDAVGPEDR